MTEELYAQVVELDSLVQHALKRIENLETQDVKGYVRIQDLEGKMEIVMNQYRNFMRPSPYDRDILRCISVSEARPENILKRIQDLEGKVEIVQNQNANLMRLTMEYRNMLQKLIQNNSIPQTRAD